MFERFNFNKVILEPVKSGINAKYEVSKKKGFYVIGKIKALKTQNVTFKKKDKNTFLIIVFFLCNEVQLGFIESFFKELLK